MFIPLSKLRLRDDSGLSEGNLHYVIAFNVLHLLSLVLLTASLLTAFFSPSIRRMSTWYTFILSVILFSVSNLLLLGHQLGPQPPHGLCTASTILIYAAPTLTAASGVAFLLQIFMNALYFIKRHGGNMLSSIWYLLLPPLVWIGVIIEVTILSIRHPDSVVREVNGMYCHSRISIISKISGIITAVGTLLILILGASTAILIYRSWTEFKQLRTRTRDGVSITLLVRIGIFSLGLIVVIGISSSKFVTKQFNEGPLQIMTACIPLLAALTIGLQTDILRIWTFRRPPLPTFTMESTTVTASRRHSHYNPHHQQRSSLDCFLDSDSASVSTRRSRYSMPPLPHAKNVGDEPVPDLPVAYRLNQHSSTLLGLPNEKSDSEV